MTRSAPSAHLASSVPEEHDRPASTAGRAPQQPARVALSGPPATGWAREPGDALRLRRSSSATAPTLRVRVEATGDDLAKVLETVLEDVRAGGPDVLVAGADVWPHAQFGDGRYVQSAHLEGVETFAHDVYLFVHAGRSIRVEVDCRLTDLLSIEDEVATIVGRLRLEAVTDA